MSADSLKGATTVAGCRCPLQPEGLKPISCGQAQQITFYTPKGCKIIAVGKDSAAHGLRDPSGSFAAEGVE